MVITRWIDLGGGGRGRRYGMGIMSESPSVPGRVTNKQTRCALGGRLAFGPIGAWYGPFTKKNVSDVSKRLFFCFVLVGRERETEGMSRLCGWWLLSVYGKS